MFFSRRHFLQSTGASVIAGPFASVSSAQAEFSFGYDATSWEDQIDEAATEISELGYRGIQIRQSSYAKFANRTAELKAMFMAKKLTLVALAAGDATLNPATMKQEIADFSLKAKWLAAVGGHYLHITDAARPTGSKPAPDDYRKLGKHLTEIGKRTMANDGIKLAYCNRMNSLGERRDEVDRILDATDPKFVWVLTDLAHLHIAGGDVVRFVRDYLNRLAYPHFNDVRISQPASTTLDGSRVAAKYDFVELGQGMVNVTSAFQIMKDYRYQGWIMIELARAIRGRPVKESAVINKRFIAETLKYKL